MSHAPTLITPRTEFPITETHGIALWPGHRLLSDSRGLGWHEVYTSLATEHSWSGTLRALPHYCLAYCAHRPARVHRTIEGEKRSVAVELRPRMLGVVPPDRESRWNLHGSPDIQLVYLHRRTIDRVAAEGFGMDPTRIELVHGLAFIDPMIEQLTVALLNASRPDGGSAGGLYADGIAQMLALHLLQRYVVRPPVAGRSSPDVTSVNMAARMRHVCDFVESALAEDLSLARLAAEAGISAHAFGACFTRAVGVTPHVYVLRRRIERAKLLLRAAELPVVEVATLTGFASQSHLASAFRRATGVTPRDYRRG